MWPKPEVPSLSVSVAVNLTTQRSFLQLPTHSPTHCKKSVIIGFQEARPRFNFQPPTTHTVSPNTINPADSKDQGSQKKLLKGALSLRTPGLQRFKKSIKRPWMDLHACSPQPQYTNTQVQFKASQTKISSPDNCHP